MGEWRVLDRPWGNEEQDTRTSTHSYKNPPSLSLCKQIRYGANPSVQTHSELHIYVYRSNWVPYKKQIQAWIQISMLPTVMRKVFVVKIRDKENVYTQRKRKAIQFAWVNNEEAVLKEVGNFQAGTARLRKDNERPKGNINKPLQAGVLINHRCLDTKHRLKTEQLSFPRNMTFTSLFDQQSAVVTIKI